MDRSKGSSRPAATARRTGAPWWSSSPHSVSHCPPGQEAPVSALKHPARRYKTPTQTRFAAGNAEGA
jgi:hypothetical protein